MSSSLAEPQGGATELRKVNGSGQPAIQVDGLVKSYDDVRAVDGVSFTVEHGEFFGILGPNGAGKTTTLELIEGLGSRTPVRSPCSASGRGHATSRSCRGSACSCRREHSSSG